MSMSNLFLSNADIGKVFIIVDVHCGCKAKLRLSNLGVLKNTEAKLVSKAPIKGPIIINIRGTSLVIGRGLSEKIEIKYIN